MIKITGYEGVIGFKTASDGNLEVHSAHFHLLYINTK